jgi:hypothetical protein
MASVMQGDAYSIPVTIKSGNGTLITPEIAACVEITVGQFTKRWPGQVTFDEKTGEWKFPVTQKQTFRFAPGTAVVQARVVFQDGSIMGGSGAPVRVEQSASRGTLPQPEKTEAVTGSAPKATEVTIPTVHDIDISLHSQVILSDPIKAPYIGDNGNWYEYDAATGTFVDTGTAASGTPPITPDTAGKYLTNDGSKAEWAKIESNLFLVHLIQGELGSDGKPIYTVDKTFAEIKTACDAGKKVELIPPANDKNFFMSVGTVPFEVVNITTKAINFQSFGVSPVGIDLIPPWTLGGIPMGVINVSISPDEKVLVDFPFFVDGDTEMPVWDVIQRLPQQYIVAVTAGADGTLSANNTLYQLQSVVQAYGFINDIIGTALINAVYNGKLYYMSASKDTSATFTATTENGLETLTVSNDGKEGSTDVWTHTITPFGNKVVVTLTRQNNKYIPSISAITIDSASQSGKNVVLKDPNNGREFPLVYSTNYDIGLATFSSVIQSSSITQGIGDPYVSTWEIRGENTVTVYNTPLLPVVSSSDNGKFLRVVDGQWAAEAVANAKGVSF